MDRKILHPAIVILQGLNEVKGLKRAGIRDHNCGDLESQRVGSGSAGFFMESGIKFLRVQGSKFSSFLRSVIKILGKNVGSVTKNMRRYMTLILCTDQLETSTSAPLGQSPAIRTFEDWIVQIPAPLGQNGVQMPYPIVGFVSHTLLKNNRCRLLPSLIQTFFVSQLLTNATSLPLNCSISSKHFFCGC